MPLLAVLCGLQLAIGLWVALSSTHNHFVWYSGGDATEYWTASWSLAHGEIGQSVVSYGVPVLFAWVPLVTGATLFGGLPVIVLIEALVLVPLALVLVWAVADLLFGRLFAWWATAFWVLAPLLVWRGFGPHYRVQFKNLFLAPHWYGLTDMADLPSLVAVLAATWAALRLVERRAVEDAVLTGLLAGAAIAIKPANGFFLPALIVLLAAIRQARPLVVAAVAFAPSLVTLALWKQRGLGSLPILSATGSTRTATGDRPIALAATNRYLHFNWTHFTQELSDLGSVFWSLRILEFIAVAGVVAVMRRSRWKGAFIAVWFASYCIVKGSSNLSSVTSLSYYRFVEPGLPAFALLAASLVFLLPRRGRAFSPGSTPRPLAGGIRTAAVAAFFLGLVPLVIVLVSAPAATAHYVRIDALANDAPLSDKLTATATPVGPNVELTWPAFDSGPTTTYYVVYRSSSGGGCTTPPRGARECLLQMSPAGMTSTPSFTDRRPGAGRHWYRIALMANYSKTLDGSDLMLIGPATAATTAR